jgi:hypothetical protein
VIGDDTREFILSFSVGVLATRDAENRPFGHECMLETVEADHIVGYVPANLAGHLADNLNDNHAAAIVISRTTGDHRSVQVKGRVAQVGELVTHPEAWAVMRPRLLVNFKQWFADAAENVIDGFARQPAHRVRIDVEQVFDQTPGPKAGNKVSGGAS